jgi:hypothetical protein
MRQTAGPEDRPGFPAFERVKKSKWRRDSSVVMAVLDTARKNLVISMSYQRPKFLTRQDPLTQPSPQGARGRGS